MPDQRSGTSPSASERLAERVCQSLNPMQRAAALHDHTPLLIVAGAGTG
jgi:hypothetical protein